MKIIEGLKMSKELAVKAQDLRAKIGQHCAYLSVETPVYPDQQGQVRQWLQAHEDITREIARLHVRITKTNLATSVTIQIGDTTLTKSITEWILRRRVLSVFDANAWGQLTDRNLKEGQVPSSVAGGVPTLVKIVRCFDPIERDKRRDLYTSEPHIIDRTLEVSNATVDLLD